MNNSKEHYEILEIFKEMINNDEIPISQMDFNKSTLKNLILCNQKFLPMRNSLKEKNKSNLEKNKNVFSLIKNINKKQHHESKIIFQHLNNTSNTQLKFSIFYNEPKYIELLNENIYQKIIEKIIECSKEFKLISITNGNSLEEILSIKDKLNFKHNKKEIITTKFILEEIYKCHNTNLNIIQPINTSMSNFNPFKFKLKFYHIQYLKDTFLQILNSLFLSEDDSMNTKKRREFLHLLIRENNRSQLVENLKNGFPSSMRRVLYLYLMGVGTTDINDTTPIEDNIFMIDCLLLQDVHHAVSNENYFLFEDNLIKLLSLLIRDKDILLEIQGTRPLLIMSSKGNIQEYVAYPMSGLFPFPGLAFQCGCFCYTSTSVQLVYPLLKAFFCKYLSYTTSFTTKKNSALCLLYTFHLNLNSLTHLKDLSKHFQAIRYDINSDVLLWFMTSFAEIITPDNVFLLYDIILLTDNLHIFIVLSLSILHYKSGKLLTVFTSEEIKMILNEIKFENINVVELMYKFLLNI
jgi:hypothetical protein